MIIKIHFYFQLFQNNAKNNVDPSTKSPVLSSVVQVRAKSDIPGVKNNLAEPEYDFLSKQPAEVIDETYKVKELQWNLLRNNLH